MSGLTPFQTVGPYLHLGLREGRSPMTAPERTSALTLSGVLLDGAGQGISDGALEFWAPAFAGIGRAWTGAGGSYRFEALRPPPRRESDGSLCAPHFAVRVLARGILTQYLTRVYFEGAPENDADTVLGAVPESRRSTLVALQVAENQYRFDIRIQGDRETVFFDL